MNILIAGGSGLIGRKLENRLIELGHEVSILSRSPKKPNQFQWNPETKLIHHPNLAKTEVLINLSGAGIADKRWTESRKKELYQSRIGTNEFLFSLVDQLPNLNHFISSSGINSYGYLNPERVYKEEDEFGSDYLSQLVREWEESADLFLSKCKVSKIRTAVVLDDKGGALERMLPAIKLGIGSPLGTGAQNMPWIHAEDLVNLFAHVIQYQLTGAINAVSDCSSNRKFMKTLAEVLKKPFFFPSVPSFVLQILFGEMSSVLLKGLTASNHKVVESGFKFHYTQLDAALSNLLLEK